MATDQAEDGATRPAPAAHPPTSQGRLLCTLCERHKAAEKFSKSQRERAPGRPRTCTVCASAAVTFVCSALTNAVAFVVAAASVAWGARAVGLDVGASGGPTLAVVMATVVVAVVIGIVTAQRPAAPLPPPPRTLAPTEPSASTDGGARALADPVATAPPTAPATATQAAETPPTAPSASTDGGARALADPVATAPPTAPATQAAETPPTAPPRVCSWSGCGKPLSADPNQWLKCGRCKREIYCDRACQKKGWKQGGHKHECKEPPCCTVCLEGGDEPLPIQCGCACRGDAGLAHIACRANVAGHKSRGCNLAWEFCPTCDQRYTGRMRMGLAREIVRRMEGRAPQDVHRLTARQNLGQALHAAGEHGEADVLLRDVLATFHRWVGPAHSGTRTARMALANGLLRQNRHAEAAPVLREMLAATPAKEQEHPNTLAAKANLAGALSEMGNHAEAEVLLRGVRATQDRLYGAEDARPLVTATMQGEELQAQGRDAEAEAIYRPTLALQQRVLGREHPSTLHTMHSLAVSLHRQGSHTEAEPLYATRPSSCTMGDTSNVSTRPPAEPRRHSRRSSPLCQENVPFVCL